MTNRLQSLTRFLLLAFFTLLPRIGAALPETHEFFVDQTSVEKYQEYVVPEALSLVESGEWILEVFSDGIDSFKPEGEASDSLSAEELIKRADDWWSSFDRITIPFTGETIEGYAKNYSFAGEVRRIVPKRVSPTVKNQILREKIVLSYGKGIEPRKWLTFRFIGAEPDAVWVYSPVLKKHRRIPASNRSDRVFGTVLHLGDLFTNSEKPEALRVVNQKASKYLSPYLKQSAGIRFRVREDCATQAAQSPLVTKVPDVAANAPQVLGSGWMPTGVAYRPSSLVRLEVESTDPFVRNHRMVLYVDKNTGLIPYKVTYNMSGKLEKFVVTVFTERNKNTFPVFTVVKELGTPRASIMRYHSLTYCKELKEKKEALKSFSPSSLAPSA